MPAVYKVRMDDGIEVGPLDVEMLRSWYQQGMIHRDTKVAPPGAKKWVKLIDTVDISTWGASAGSKARGDGPDEDVYEEEDDEGPQTWRTYVASAFFFLAAAATGYLAFFPDQWLAALRGTPWREIALASTALGLLLVRGWEPARKVVRVLVCLLTFALFPLAGLVLFRGIHMETIAILVSAWAMGSGLFFFLAGRTLAWTSAALSLFWVLAGAAGVAWFGFLPLRAATQGTPAAVETTPVSLTPQGPAVATITQEVPLLTARSAERVMAHGASSPPEAFRFAYALAADGLAVLSGEERKELAETTAAAYATLAPSDRDRLAAYMERVRTRAVTLPQEDREMSLLMKGAVLKLSEEQRARLQALYEKAMGAAR